ncbi:MAG TPA: addiction module antidote protein [Pyrinomonadaceae bacterium]
MRNKVEPKRTGDFREYVIGSLKDDLKLASEYLNAAMEDGDVQVFLMALGDLAKARGMSNVSKKTGLNRENIYRIVSTKGNPQIKSVFALLDALGLKLKTEPVRPPRKKLDQTA